MHLLIENIEKHSCQLILSRPHFSKRMNANHSDSN